MNPKEKNEAGVGAAAVCGDNIRTTTLPNRVSIYTAEMYAIKLAFDIAEDIDEERMLICSDSRSALNRLEVLREDGHIMRQFQHYVYTRKQYGFQIVLLDTGTRKNKGERKSRRSS